MGTPPKNPIIAFFRGEIPDAEGRMISEIRSFDHDALESTQDYLQWLFPLRTPSQATPSAPTLDEATIRAFHTEERLRAELLSSFQVMLEFYGFRLHAPPGRPVTVVRSAAWERRRRVWLSPRNHNFLRITRILGCLTTLGLSPYAHALFAALKDVYEEEAANVIGRQTYAFWVAAVGGAAPAPRGRS